MGKRILIVGGSGFLGSALAGVLLTENHEVWTLSRGRMVPPEGTVSLLADRGQRELFERTVRHADTYWDFVFDCAGYTPEQVHATLLLLPDLAEHYIFISSDLVYDPNKRRLPESEDTIHYAKAGYGFSKRQCELRVMDPSYKIARRTIFRPCHIYGPGSQLGCFPLHLRDPLLISNLRKGLPLRLVEAGYFLQHPVFIDDLARTLAGVIGNPNTYNELFCVAGPEVLRSVDYYVLIAEILGYSLRIEAVPPAEYVEDNLDGPGYLCHRVYELTKLHMSGLPIPNTTMLGGLKQHLEALLS